MPRARGGVKARQRHKKVLKRASGFYSSGSRTYRQAIQRVDRALAFAFRDRKVRKRKFRELWTIRINAAARANGTTYSRLIGAINEKGLQLDRKVLADMALNDAQGFSSIVKELGL